MRKFFNRKKKVENEVAPALALYQRRAWEIPGASAGQLSAKIYDEMERDSMIQTALTIKKLSVLSSPFKLVVDESSPEAVKRRDFIKEAFARMEGSPMTIIFAALDAFAKGWSVQEIVYKVDRDRVWLEAVRAKDPAVFGLSADEFGHIRELKLQMPGGETRTLPRAKFAIFANRAGYGRLKGQSDLDPAFRHWQAKNALFLAWKVHLERFASPTVLGRYDRGLPSEEQGKILAALNSLQDSTALVFPKEIDVETLGGAKEQTAGFLDALEFHNREMARSILGQTLTTDEGRRVGSLALGKVHLQVLLLQITAIRREIADSLMTEQIIRPLIDMNFGPGPIPRFEFENTQLEAFATGQIK